MKIVIAILVFSILILFHEFGHFITAKASGVTVLEFSLGMGPRLLSHVSGKSGTRYSLKLLPFGGSCMMKGEDEDDTSEGAFGSAPVFSRILIVAAGPVFNFILAYVFSLFVIGAAGYDPPLVLSVTEDFPAQEAGIEEGDIITGLGSSKVYLYRDISNYVLFHQKDMAEGKEMKISWKHDGEKKSAVIVPKKAEDGRFLIGIAGSNAYRVRGNVPQVLYYSAVETGYWIRTTIDSLKMMLSGQVSADDVSGPVGVVKTIGDTYEESKSDGAFYVWLNMLQISILLSANLGVMNLLPFPALDGGRLVFLLIEAVRRKKVNQRIESAVNFAGFAILMGLMVLILLNDTRRLI